MRFLNIYNYICEKKEQRVKVFYHIKKNGRKQKHFQKRRGYLNQTVKKRYLVLK